MQYQPKDIEKKWRDHWIKSELYKVSEDPSKPKFYVLDMFPYPSGAGLHVGHPLGYIASDIYSRFKRMSGFNVLHPMGFDAFGLPAEDYAIQSGIHPAVSTSENMERYREQLGSLGFSFDWSREVQTCNPDYYKWTQWIFTQLFEHAYDNAVETAISIENVRESFSKTGTSDVNFSCEEEMTFTAGDWNGWDRIKQEEILMNYRLAFRKVGYVNWCEELGTVLANDQVKDGRSERGGHPVVQRPMTQWYLRITAYAQRLLDGLETVNWSESLVSMQRNWIGRSEGAQVFFPIENSDRKIEIFTTRPDTIFGATYMVLAPEHDWVNDLTTETQEEEVRTYVQKVMSKSEIERMAEKEVTGVWLGSYAIHPFTGLRIPIWIGEYVLKDYGTGAIMAVPSDDDRDFNFASKFGLEIIEVVDKSKFPDAGRNEKIGILQNSDFLNGMNVKEAIPKICSVIEERGLGKARINFRMRDANFSRQRYWGEPFPISYDSEGIAVSADLADLPVTLPPTEDFRPAKDKSPLARLTDWVHEQAGLIRETDVMPAVAGSSWYYLRYMDPNNPDKIASEESINYWQDVDLYIGGAEHAVAHLLYARFWHKFLFDKGLVPTEEPFKRLINQGMIQGIIEFIYLDKSVNDIKRFVSLEVAEKEGEEKFAKIPVHVDFVSDYGSNASYLSQEGILQFSKWRPEYIHATFEGFKSSAEIKNGTLVATSPDFQLTTKSEVGKMSKSLFNVINPDEVIERYGTDCFRMYEMFLGPIEQAKPWDIQGIDGVYKFLKKFWALFIDQDGNLKTDDNKPSADDSRILHECIKKVSSDVQKFSFNTCISAFMIATNQFRDSKCCSRSVLEEMLRLLSPFAPHVTEELWALLGHEKSIHLESYPKHDEAFLVKDSIEYPICINGKKRSLMEFPADSSHDELKKSAVENADVQKWIDGKEIRKIIVVPGRMINIVV